MEIPEKGGARVTIAPHPRMRRGSFSKRSKMHIARRESHYPSGVFQTETAVELINDGPVTILVDSEKKF
jgi:D-Tyr-tRNAtyr deacylase